VSHVRCCECMSHNVTAQQDTLLLVTVSGIMAGSLIS